MANKCYEKLIREDAICDVHAIRVEDDYRGEVLYDELCVNYMISEAF